jgi:hypothetical protein
MATSQAETEDFENISPVVSRLAASTPPTQEDNFGQLTRWDRLHLQFENKCDYRFFMHLRIPRVAHIHEAVPAACGKCRPLQDPSTSATSSTSARPFRVSRSTYRTSPSGHLQYRLMASLAKYCECRHMQLSAPAVGAAACCGCLCCSLLTSCFLVLAAGG